MRAEGVRGTPALQVVGAMAEEGEPEAEPEPEPTELELAAGFPQTPQHIQVKFSEAAAAVSFDTGAFQAAAQKAIKACAATTVAWAKDVPAQVRLPTGLGAAPEI